MIKFIINIFLTIVLCLTVLSGCVDGVEPEPLPQEPETVNRTVLVYMVASNNLGTGNFDRADLAEMQQAAAEGQISDGRLIVYHHAPSEEPLLLEIKAAGADTLVHYDSAVSSVASERMRQVIADTKSIAPAHDYGMVLWSHASGWLQDGIDDPLDSGDPQPLAFGQDRGQKMNLTTLARTLEGQDISWIYFDCCYMGSVEVAFELRHAVRSIVGSSSEIPADGMPYDVNVQYFFRPEADLCEAARKTFGYYDALTGQARTCTMSVISTEGLDEFARATADIYTSVTDYYPEGYEPQRFMTESRCYHFDLADYVEAICTDGQAMDYWRQALDRVVLYRAATPRLWNTVDINSHCGLTTYIFTNEAASRIKNYRETAWYQQVASKLFTTDKQTPLR